MQDFVHLHVHTQYSLLDGQASVARLVDKAMQNGMKGIAVTDHGNMFGIKEFTNYVNKKNSGPKGEVKDLDSLADDVSFGVAPSLIVFSLFKEMYYPANMEFIAPYLPYLAFLISVFSALRLAKFNNDTRQTSSFVGLPVPANALFWGSLVAGAHDFLISDNCHPVYLLILVCLFSGLLVSEIPMFSLKFKNLSWNDNKISFIFLIICIPLLLLLGISSFAAIIVWYILLSLFTRKSK